MAHKRPKTHTSVWIMAKNKPYDVLINRGKNQNNHSHSFWKIGLEGLFLGWFRSKMAQKHPKTRTSLSNMAQNEPYDVLITREKNQNNCSNYYREIGLEGLFKRSFQPKMAQKCPNTLIFFPGDLHVTRCILSHNTDRHEGFWALFSNFGPKWLLEKPY